MSQPLDSAMPGRPPNVPFFGQDRHVFMFLCEKNCACGHGLSVQVCLDPWTVQHQADLRMYLFLGGKGMFLCFYVKKIVPVDMALVYVSVCKFTRTYTRYIVGPWI
jgi:hypothetical protein